MSSIRGVTFPILASLDINLIKSFVDNSSFLLIIWCFKRGLQSLPIFCSTKLATILSQNVAKIFSSPFYILKKTVDSVLRFRKSLNIIFGYNFQVQDKIQVCRKNSVRIRITFIQQFPSLWQIFIIVHQSFNTSKRLTFKVIPQSYESLNFCEVNFGNFKGSAFMIFDFVFSCIKFCVSDL